MSRATRGSKETVGRLTKIELENYRAFRGHFEIELPNGCNLLVYGENGAGKSSLFNALTDFFESPYTRIYDEKSKSRRAVRYDDFRYRFSTDPAAVRLTFGASLEGSINGGQTQQQKTYEWSASKNDPTTAEMRTLDKGKGCLDYRSLLRMHLLPVGKRNIDLFELFINPLLAHYKNPASTSSLTFAEEWERIKEVFEPYVRKPSRLDDWISEFNAGFERVAKDTVALASKLLTDFDDELAVEIDFSKASYAWGPKVLIPPKINARPIFKRLHHPDYHRFLNEARLSALAITMYFAGLKESPAGDFRLLVLDDILIGLDMGNRMAVLRIVEKLFPGWQVLILTYHKAWFEILKSRTTDGHWTHPWKSVILRERSAVGIDLPIVATESGSLLRQAQAHLERGDPKAAAVYARSAWEAVLSGYCTEWRLPVPYVEYRRELDTNDFLRSIKSQLDRIRNGSDRAWAQSILKEVQHARRFVLNPNAHFDPEMDDEISAEIVDSIRIVAQFEMFLRLLRKSDFVEPSEKRERPSVGALLHIAAEHAEANRHSAALVSLAQAFEQYLDELFRLAEIAIPFGADPTPLFLFTWAGRFLFEGLIGWKVLRHAQPYLLGTISLRRFDLIDFRSAFQLTVRLRIIFLLEKRRREAKPLKGSSGRIRSYKPPVIS